MMAHTNTPTVGLGETVAQAVVPHLIEKRGARLVRVLWTFAAGLALSIFLVSVPAYVLDLNQPVDWAVLDHPVKPMLALALIKNSLSITAVVICFILAGILFRYKRNDRMAVYASFLLLFYAVASAGPTEQLAVYDSSLERVGQTVVFLAAIPWVFFFSLFPSGRFVPRWSRWLSVFSFPWAFVLAAFHPFSRIASGPVPPLLELLWTMSLPLLVVYAQIWRYRHASGAVERQQTKWIVFGLFIALTLFTVSTIPWVYVQNRPAGTIGIVWANWIMFFLQVIWVIMLCVLPLSMTVAVLRYRLWDINLIINRTLVYTSLTALVVSLYALIVGALGAVLQARGSLVVSLLATGVVAMLFQPLRERLQHAANRWMYGERDNPYAVLARLGQQLETAFAPTEVLPTLVETVAHTLKLPYVAIALKRGNRFKIASEYGLAPAWMREASRSENGTHSLVLPLVYQAEIIGRLILAPRSPNDPFTPAEHVLLEDMARQVGISARAVQLTADLQQSRERLVTTREEERRRLRRDLHDGLGPALAAMSFKLDATTNVIGHDPDRGRALVADLKAQVQTLLDDIRRIAYDLRPPALDELGLVGALREHIASSQAQGLHITLDAPETLPPLPAAVEVAAYRIALEAINNVNRHAHARYCSVRLALCDDLCLEISDDGRGFPAHVRAGVGMASMRERAEELGGKCELERQPGQGTRVLVRLPLMTEALAEEE
jgi:signal transduction histidine kinase